MSLTRVFNGTLDSSTLNITDSFKDATGLFMVMPSITDEFELDFYLQLEVESIAGSNRLIRLIETFRQDTILVFAIPLEFQLTGLSMHGTLLPTVNLPCEVWVIHQEVTLKTVYELLEDFELPSDTNQDMLSYLIQVIFSFATGTPLPLPPPELLPSLPELPSSGSGNGTGSIGFAQGFGIAPNNSLIPLEIP